MPERDIEQLPDEVAAKEVKRILLPYLNRQEAVQVLQTNYQLKNGDDAGDLSQVERQELLQEFSQQHEESKDAIEPLDIELMVPDMEPIEHDHLDEFTNRPEFKQAMADLDEDRMLEQQLEAEVPEDVDEDDDVDELIEEELPEWMSADGIDFEALPEDELKDYEIVEFPISHLVAMQKTVTTDAYGDLPTDDDEFDDLLEYCLPTEGETMQMVSPISTAGNEFNGVQVTSRNPNVGAQIVTEQQEGETRVTVIIGGSPNFVQVKEYAGRYILKNGYHRVVRLFEAGHTHVPAVLSSADDWSDVTMDDGHFDRDVILQDRPPMVKDFFAGWAEQVTQPATNTVVRVLQETTEIPR